MMGGSFVLLDADGTAYDIATAPSGRDNADTDSHTDDRGFELAGNVLTLQAGADANNYTARVQYTDRVGNTFVQQIDITTTEASNPGTATVTQVSTDQTKDAVTASTEVAGGKSCLLYTSPSPRDRQKSRMPSSA